MGIVCIRFEFHPLAPKLPGVTCTIISAIAGASPFLLIGVLMYAKGKRDSPKRQTKKKPKLTIKEKRKRKKEKKQ